MTDRTMPPRQIFLGTAGWTIPRASAEAFPADGSGLERYATRFNAVEINSTFYRSHRPSTLERWRATTPPAFRFAVKAPKAITHEARLLNVSARLRQFLNEIAPLGDKLGPILVQLPPSLVFDEPAATDFLAGLRSQWDGAVALEPRHVSWFEPAVMSVLSAHRVGRVGADPARTPEAAAPGGDPAYWRLHGSPRPYYSAYDLPTLEALAQAIVETRKGDAWCIFDNTASGAAAANALTLAALLGDAQSRPPALR